ncbi:hypothetical protein F3J45_21270 [Pantoea sp. Ap-967]|uniref:NEL-type E3 ubiquitin ligase domain-containing protein n=1 Tax=Pantoea sp. Ap-967 TaxID=2608362 RepID=UPI001423CDBD|nr:NEL-type E3 ubiquitin ligase domain-containing protein [Pantoea sp. Ap-967]NIE76973.1 hypothetical protein [Pantoea sp. Ap-967]
MPPSRTPGSPRITEQFIGQQLPAWLANASAQSLAALRARVTARLASQREINRVSAQVEPLDDFARRRLEAELNLPVALSTLVWREERRHLRTSPLGLPDFSSYFVRMPALQKLMQNFKPRESFFEQTALVSPPVEPGQDDRVVDTQVDDIVEACRRVDVGKAYQQHLADVLNGPFEHALAEDKRLELSLAIEVAALKGQVQGENLKMLRQLASGVQPTHPLSRRVAVGGVEVLGCRVDGALCLELLGTWTPGGSVVLNPELLQGVMLYWPDDPQRPLRYYNDWDEANRALAGALADEHARGAFARRVGLAERAQCLALLATRLQDDAPDLQPRRLQATANLFGQLAQWHVARIKADAAYLAVPTAQADSEASAERLRTLQSAGLALLNLAGLFVPALGALLLADAVGQLLGEVFEGANDWSLGHQHEALQHLLQVALSLASVGVVAGGAYAVRSAFVEQLEPVRNPAGQARLWRNDLAPYQQTQPSVPLIERDDGLLTDGSHCWWRQGAALYRVRQDAAGTWRLLHRDGPGRYGPALRGNGERAWWLASERPLEWQGMHWLLARLWPAASTLDTERVTQILKVADIDEVYLRGLLVEGRRLPVQLRDTLERFAVDARIEAFLGQPDDNELLQWCVDRLGLQGEPLQVQLDNVKQEAQALRGPMFEHFSARYLPTEPLLALLKRDFPSLPDAYAVDVLNQASMAVREPMQAQARVPLALAERARGALQLARLTRTRETLYLRSSYRPEGVALAFALLRRNGLSQSQVNLELRAQSALGALQERLLPEAPGQQTQVLVWQDGQFALYDSRGLPSTLTVAEPQGLCEVLAACLPASYQTLRGWSGAQAPEQLRAALQGWLPDTSQAQLRLLGWREARPMGAPMRRLADGRLGYLLGGHASKRPAASAPRQTLRERIRALYPSLDDTDVERYLLILTDDTPSPFHSLLLQELQYQALDESLARWTGEAQGRAQADRYHVARALRRAWRFEGEQQVDADGSIVGLRLSIIAIPVAQLPALPANSDFAHVTDLTLVGLRLSQVPPGFLGRFTGLRHLDLSNNQLGALPDGLQSMPELRHLNLQRNRMRLTAEQLSVLASRTELRTLDLSENTLGRGGLDVSALLRLRDLRLRRTGLQAVPRGLQWCAQLEYADLRDNHIVDLPQTLLDAPAQLRQTLNVRGNAIPAAQLEQLYLPDHVPTAAPEGLSDLAEARRQWLATQADAEQAARAEAWDRLQHEPGSEAFFDVLVGLVHTAEFRVAPAGIGARVWGMIDALLAEQRLRQELFALADEPRACADNIANCFSSLEVRAQVLHATQGGDPLATRGERLLLAQRLFRLDTVLALARADIEARYADGRWQRGAHAEEEVEVSLAYRTGLATRLNLIGQPRHMLFSAIASVPPEAIERAYLAVLSAESTEARVLYISQRDFWVPVLRAAHRAAFDAVEQAFDEALETLDGNRERLGSGAYDQQARELMARREQALQALALRLTREELTKP